MSMELIELNEAEFEGFMKHQPLANFLQSSAIGKRRQLSGWEPHFVGVKRDDVVVAAALLSSRRAVRQYRDFECLQGPIMDYGDETLVRFFFDELKPYLRARNAISVRINPPLLLNHRDNDGKVIKDGYDGTNYIRLLKTMGLKHLDNRAIDQDPLSLRWYFVKDLQGISDEDELLKGFDVKARHGVRKAQKFGVEVVALPHDNLDELYEVLAHTGERRQFDQRDKKYYEDLARLFGPKESLFCVARLEVSVYKEYLETGIKAERENLARINEKQEKWPDDTRLANQQLASQKLIENLEQRLAALPELGTKKSITLAGAVFIHYGQELVYLASGSYDNYASFDAPYALQWHAMTYALERPIPYYNFYGTHGDFDGHPEQQGVYKFKKGFGGVVQEQIGYFTIVFLPALQLLRKTVVSMRKKLV